MTRAEYRKQNAPSLNKELQSYDAVQLRKLMYGRMVLAATPQIDPFYECDPSTKTLMNALEALRRFPTKDNFYNWLKVKFKDKNELIKSIVADYTDFEDYDCLLDRDEPDTFNTCNITRVIMRITSIWLSRLVFAFLNEQNILLWSFRTFNPYRHTCGGK